MPVYLINASDKTYPLKIVALELPIVLEADLGDGHWERAEVSNSYAYSSHAPRKTQYVNSQHYRVKHARYWEAGQPARLRYALYQDGAAHLVSEPFDGYLSPGQIEAARHDLMSAAMIPPPLQIRYVPERTDNKEVLSHWYARLSLLQSYGPCHIDTREAQEWISDVYADPISSAIEREVAVDLQLLMLQPWPQTYEIERLHQQCREMVSAPSSDKVLRQRELSWQVLSYAANQHATLHHPELLDVAWKAIQQPEIRVAEKLAATEFLCSVGASKALSPKHSETELLSLLDRGNTFQRIVAAHTLMIAGKHRFIMQHYGTIADEISSYELTKILHFDRLYKPYNKPDWQLWETALDKDTAYTFAQLAYLFESDDRPTKLRKFANSSELTLAIRNKLEAYYQQLTTGDQRVAVRRLLDNIEASDADPFR